MGDHLKVDLDELASTASSLTALCASFQSAADEVDAVADDLGHPDLTDAMHDFATNWDYHKARLVELLESIRDMADEGHKTYVGVDTQLAQNLAAASHGAVAE